MSESAIRTFMKLNDINGASTYYNEVGSVEILGWSHGFSQPTQLARAPGTSGSAGKAKHRDIIVRKQVDKTTRDILKKCWEGGQINQVTISAYNADVKYLQIVLDKVIISDMDLDDDGGIVTEELCLNYAKVKYIYTPVDESGVAQGEIPVEHDIETGIIS